MRTIDARRINRAGEVSEHADQEKLSRRVSVQRDNTGKVRHSVDNTGKARYSVDNTGKARYSVDTSHGCRQLLTFDEGFRCSPCMP